MQVKDNAAAHQEDSDGVSVNYDTNIDNTAPVIKFSNYKTEDQVYGSSSVTLRGTAEDKLDVTKLEYALTKLPTETPSGWKTITDTSKPNYTNGINWQIVFDGNTDAVDTSSYHAGLLRDSLFTLYNVATADQAAYDTTQPVYIWIRAEDKLENSKQNTEPFCLKVIPNADRPAVKITYPEKTTVEDNKLGGTIRITGSAEVRDTNAKVSAVYLQIDPNYNGSSFSDNWYSDVQTLLNDKASTDYAPVQVTKYLDAAGTEKTLSDANAVPTGYGIAVNGDANSWILPINRLGEYNSTISVDKVDEDGNPVLDNDNNPVQIQVNRKIAIRAVAISTTGKTTTSQIYVCEVDADAPTFGDNEQLRFVHYGVDGKEDASRAFVTGGIKLKGQWYLEGSVEDGTGIASITFNKTKIEGNKRTVETPLNIVSTDTNGTVTANSTYATAQSWKGNTSHGYQIKIPVSVATENAVAEYEYDLVITDNSTQNLPNNTKFNVLYDNNKPSFSVMNGGGIELSTAANAKNEMRQSNGAYTVNGTFSEASGESGFGRIVMYFTKTRTAKNEQNQNVETVYLLDPMVDDGTNGKANWLNYVISTKTGDAERQFTDGFTEKEGMFWRTVVIKQLTTNVIELNAAPSTLNIREGGLCMVNNVIYRIKTVKDSEKKVTLEGTLVNIESSASAADRTVYFALAQVIDNMSQETVASDNKGTRVYNYSGEDPITSKDGDFMLEGVVLNQGIYNWNVSLDSSNMMDGIATMTFIAFDAAGNRTDAANYNMKISNNAPRLAGVTFGADKNMDGDYDDEGEIDSSWSEKWKNKKLNNRPASEPGYNGQDEEGNWITYLAPYATNGKRLAVKGKMFVTPEIVGGNTALAWSYTYKKIPDSGTTLVDAETTKTQFAGLGHSNDGSIRPVDSTKIEISLSDILANKIADGDQTMEFSIWDRTDDAAFGEDEAGSERTYITIPVTINVRDTAAPTTRIDPFHWSSSNNSLYNNSKDNGHIEIESELPGGTFTTNGSGVYDRDAKVSGMITFEGTATDNVTVNKISVMIPGYNDDEEFTIAERDPSKTTTGGWKSVSGTVDNLVNHLYYSNVDANGNKTPIEGYQPTLLGTSGLDWVCELTNKSDTYDSATGENTVTFKFHFNTANILKKADVDVGIEFYAYDKGAPSLGADGSITYPNPKASVIPTKTVGTGDDAVTTNISTGNVFSKKWSAAKSEPGALSYYFTDNTLKTPVNANTADDATVYTNKTPYYKVDVVPYITKLYTRLSNSAGEEFARSATGKYILRENETVKMYGFNLAVDNNAVKIGDTNITPTEGASDANGSYINLPIGTTAVSGPLTITVNEVVCLNNKNADPVFSSDTDDTIQSVEYNSRANVKTNKRLNDDVEVWIWNLGYFLTNTNITSPMMRMDKAGNYYMSYGSGIQNMYVNKNGTTQSVDFSYNKFHNTNVTFDDNGRIHAVAMNTDRIHNDSSRYVLYTPSGTNTFPGKVDSDSPSYAASSTTKRHLELAYSERKDNKALYNINRVKDSKLATYTDGTTTYIAMAYYDDNNSISPVKFRFGTNEEGGEEKYNGNGTSITLTYSNNIAVYTSSMWGGSGSTSIKSGWVTSDNTKDYVGTANNKYVLINGEYKNITRTQYQSQKNGTNKYYYTITDYNTTNTPITSDIYTKTTTAAEITGGIYGQIGTGVRSSSNTPTITMTESNDPTITDSSAAGYHIVADSSETTSFKSGPYAAVGIVPKKNDNNELTGFVGVVAWYDASSKRVCFSWNENPVSAVVGGDWQTHAKYLDGEYTGWYVDMNVDGEGGIHIAYYNSAKGDLKYVYLSRYDAEPTEPVTIDSYLSVGTDLTIETRLENDEYVPYIYYYNASSNKTPNSIKVAWREDMETLRDGAVNDLFTGSWESMTIPTTNVPVEATVCGGIPTSGTYGNSVVLGYMSDTGYEKAYIKGNIY